MRAQLFADLPVAELIKRRWINVEDIRDANAVDAALIEFFEGQSPTQIAGTPHAAKRLRLENNLLPRNSLGSIAFAKSPRNCWSLDMTKRLPERRSRG